MTVFLCFCGIVGFCLLVGFPPRWARRLPRKHVSYPGPPPRVGDGLAQRNAEIVRLHRELGIDPIYDPIQPQLPTDGKVPADVAFILRMTEPPPKYVGPLRIYKCAKCDFTVTAEMTGYKEAFNAHLADVHGITGGQPPGS